MTSLTMNNLDDFNNSDTKKDLIDDGYGMAKSKIESDKDKPYDRAATDDKAEPVLFAKPTVAKETTTKIVETDFSGHIDAFDDEIEADDKETKQQKQFRRLLSNSWLRLAFILSCLGLFAVAWAVVSLVNKNPEDKLMVEGGGAQPIEVREKTLEKASLNEAQAEHIMKLKQQEAEQVLRNGSTNAATLEVPDRELKQGKDSLGESGAATNGQQKTRYPFEGENLNDTTRYQKVFSGNEPYYVDKINNVKIIPKPVYQGNASANPNAVIAAGNANNPNVTTSASNNPSPISNNTTTGGGGNSGNGGNNTNPQATTNTQNQDNQDQNNQNAQAQATKAPDADLERIKNELATSYDQYSQQQQAMQQAQIAELQKQQAQAAALQQERQAKARASFAETLQKLNIGKSAASFTSSNYLTSGQSGSDLTGSTSGLNGGSISTNRHDTNMYGQTTNGSVSVDAANNNKPNENGVLPSNIVRAGTSWMVSVLNKVNTDNGSYVTAQILNGKLAGSTVYGVIEPSGRNIGISFTSILPKGTRRAVIPVNAIAMTIGGNSSVASKVNNHYTQNYGTMLLTSVIGGYGAAYSEPEQETTVSDGVVVTTQKESTSKQLRANIYQQLANQINSDIARFGSRPPTYIINQGTVLNMTLIDNLDLKGTADSISALTQRGGLTSRDGSNSTSNSTSTTKRGQ